MVTVIAGREFRPPGGPYSYELPDPLEDVEAQRCTFASLQSPAQRTLDSRPTLRHVKLTRCHFQASDLGPVIAEECDLDTAWFHRGIWGPQKLGGCAFRHVTIRGNITGSLAIQYWPFGEMRASRTRAVDHPFVKANAAYYRDVDWALDISAARFTGFDMWLSDIPAGLVRRDPPTQAVLTRSKLLDDRWAELDLPEPSFGFAIEMFLESGLPDTIMVACKRNRRFEAERATIELLRAEGIAEID
jgi:hypothetical protein